MAATQIRMLTANRLRDGAVVYWRNGCWGEAFTDGDTFETTEAAQSALQAAAAFVAAQIVVNPYLFAVRIDNDVRRAVEEREIVRSEGPSVRRDTGKTIPRLPPTRSLRERDPHEGDVKHGGGFDVSL